ncbi:hypothetical protein OW763_06850 [Clostridium aestuarii]|uniref:Uncharacterized protein n=1 Tax=Clostridium aestuarii TaxID=338193 RepID=A0ABT4CYL6_9CLOT|nr:hypothetical protein [Clostridium aestuarii]MCY6484069.1 hypothetical protein [Clostridium aestuarii]
MGKKTQPKKATKKNNDNRSNILNPNSTSYEMAQEGLITQINPSNNKTKNNKS